MTDLSIIKGDRQKKQFTITDSEPVPGPIDLTGSVARLVVKRRSGDDDDEAAIRLRSYFAAEIQFTDLVGGVGLYDILPWRTRRLDPADYVWGFELVRPNESLTAVGAIAVLAGSGVMTGTATVLTSVREGDLLVAAGALPGNAKTVVITAVGGQGQDDDPGAGNLLTDYEFGTDEGGISFEVFRGDVKTTDSGKFTILPDCAAV